jgi:hypothetical protein
MIQVTTATMHDDTASDSDDDNGSDDVKTEVKVSDSKATQKCSKVIKS